MGGQGSDGLPLRHSGPSGHTGEDYALADAGQGILRLQRRRRPAEGGDAGGKVVGDTQPVQSVHLFPDRSVQAGVSGVEADGRLSFQLPLSHDVQHLFQGHLGAVIEGAVRLAQLQQGGIDQTAGVDHHVRLFQQLRAPQGDEIRGPRPRAHKMYHPFTPLQ